VPPDFEDACGGGRGDSYREAQRDPTVRLHGIRQLFALAAPDGRLRSWRPQHVVLDMLGGDGTLARAVAAVLPRWCRPTVLTSDLSAGMVAAAQRLGLPALRQPAQALRLRDGSVDAVVLAYGTHHVPPAERPAAAAEALRVLRPGGRLVLHDFEDPSPVSRWFRDVVHPLSRTGHPYPHFTASGMRDLLTGAGFTRVEVRRVYDPFRLLGPDPATARRLLGRHLLDMYGLERVRGDDPVAAAERVAALADECLRYTPAQASPGQPTLRARYETSSAGCRVELPRVALVASGTRSATVG
jgi:SAM-dependent methyltransferase